MVRCDPIHRTSQANKSLGMKIDIQEPHVMFVANESVPAAD